MENNNINMDVFYNTALTYINQLETKEMSNLKDAAAICAETMINDGVVHIFGSGHSVGFGMELTGRPGSLVPFHMIETNDFVLKGLYSLTEFRDQDNIFERRPNIADKLYELYDIRPQDSFIIISNSGINGLVIDLALTAKAKNHKVIVVTSWNHTLAEPSRHPSGKKLHELGDVVIDNCGPQGDAMISIDDSAKICSISSITGVFIAQSLTVEICSIYQQKELKAPLLTLGITTEDQETNKLLAEKYISRWR